MKIKEPAIEITLTKNEAITIQKSLHKVYMDLKALDPGEASTRGIAEIRELRNQFCGIAGSMYMGIDA